MAAVSEKAVPVGGAMTKAPGRSPANPLLPNPRRKKVMRRVCRVEMAPKPLCVETEFGCCPDFKTAAEGPFQLGPIPFFLPLHHLLCRWSSRSLVGLALVRFKAVWQRCKSWPFYR